jgi:hypothetical protein
VLAMSSSLIPPFLPALVTWRGGVGCMAEQTCKIERSWNLMHSRTTCKMLMMNPFVLGGFFGWRSVGVH